MVAYKLSGLHVAHQNIDGEVIIVDLKSGFYFSATGCGPFIWERLVHGASWDQLAGAMAAAFDAPPERIQSTLNGFIERLKAEGLIVETADKSPVDLAPEAQSIRLALEDAIIEKYTDLEQALVLDPIHDCDETGWPNQQVVVNQFHTA